MIDAPKWDRRFLRLAREVSTYSKDPNTKMGAVLVSLDRRYIAYGYNGFPRGIADNWRLQQRDLKRSMMEHAETNCLYNAPFDSHVIPCGLYITGSPCSGCAKAIIQKGIEQVIYLRYAFIPYWEEDMDLAQELLKEAGVVVREHSEDFLDVR